MLYEWVIQRYGRYEGLDELWYRLGVALSEDNDVFFFGFFFYGLGCRCHFGFSRGFEA